MNLERIAAKFNTDEFNSLNEEMSFAEYLDKVYVNPLIIRTAYQRLHDMIVSDGVEEIYESKEKLFKYNFFSKHEIPIFGLHKPLSELVKFFKGAAGGYGTEKRVLLLHGPVGSSKSTILRLIKFALEKYSTTDAGAWYSFKWINLPTGKDGIYTHCENDCPMHEEPLKLIPKPFRDKVVAELNEINRENKFGEQFIYDLTCIGELDPRCRKFMKELLIREKGDWKAVVDKYIKVVRKVHSEADRCGIATFQPKDEKNQDATELTGDIDFGKIGHFGADSDARAFSFDGEFCFPAGTPVRMANGSEKEIEKVKVGDEVTTHVGKSRKVLSLFNRKFSGEMVKIHVKGFPFPLTMTSDHPVGVIAGTCDWRWQPGALTWKHASELEENDRVIIGWSRQNDAKNKILNVLDYLGDGAIDLNDLMNDKCNTFSSKSNKDTAIKKCSQVNWRDRVKLPYSQYNKAILKFVSICPSLGRLIGLYLAEGCCTKKRVIFNLGSHEESLGGEILALVKGLFGINGRIKLSNKRKTALLVIFGNVNFVKFIKTLAPGNAFTKRVPSIFMDSNENVKMAVLQGWLDGDGHMRVKTAKKAHIVVYGSTSSSGMARDFTTLALACGLKTSCHKRKAYNRTKENYIVKVAGRKVFDLLPALALKAKSQGICLHEKDINRCDFGYARPITKVEKEVVENFPVYDFEVEEDHSFLANDLVVHNCCANRGIIEFIEMLKLAQEFLYDLLGASQERQIKPKKFSQISIDEAIIGHSVHGDTPIPHEYDGVLDVLPISELSKLDVSKLRVFSVNVETHEVELSEVKKVFSHKFEGEWIENHQDGDTITTTPNHSVYDKNYQTFYPGEDTTSEILTIEIPDYLVQNMQKTSRWTNFFEMAENNAIKCD